MNLIREVALTTGSAVDWRGLQLMALSTEKSQASQWPSETQQGPAVATVHPDAAPNNLDGDVVLLESDVASITVRLKFDSRQRKDVALMDKGGWHQAGRCANALIRGKLTDAGQCAVYYETPVRIRQCTNVPSRSHNSLAAAATTK